MTKVLVVDDEVSITDGLLALFSLEQIDAAGAYDLAGAEKMIDADFYPVVLADLRLVTERDGLELIRHIRSTSPRSKIATLTAFATVELEQRLLEMGSSIVLRKPMSFDDIVAVISEMLGTIEQAAQTQQIETGAALNLELLYHDVRRVLFSIPQRRYGFDASEAEELVQDAWMLFLQKQSSIENSKAWLCGVMGNLCKQAIYRKTRQRERCCELTDADDAFMATEPEAESRLDQILVRSALARLDDRSRSLCTLIGLEGWTYEEVSDELGLPIGSVGPLYIRAKNKLRKAIEQTH